MNEDQNRHHEADDRLPEPHESHGQGRRPGGLTWPIRRFYWFLEKHLLWPVADSFKKLSSGISRAFRYRSPLAYIGATMLLTLTGTAIGAAVYFHNEAKDAETPVTAQVPLEPETVIATTPAPVPVSPVTSPNEAKADDELKGVVPDFEESSSKSSSNSGSSDSSSTGNKENALPETVVKPADVPDSPPLKVAHNFAETFVDYEVGKKGVARNFTRTATTKLSKELRSDPPRQPSNGDIPKATVLNVVQGKKSGDRMEVSVSLMRSGATSELRLALSQEKKKWLVSEVRG